MNVLVTGASGFIGLALCERLIALSIPFRAAIRSANKADNLPAGIDTVRIAALDSRTDWTQALAGIDIVVHLAARAHIMNENSTDSLSVYREVNVDGTRRLMQMSTAAGVKRFIFLSTVKVNGEKTAISYSEEDVPSPKDPYGISKWEAEEIIKRIACDTATEVVILRPPLVYGPGVKANFLQLIKTIERGIPLPLASVDNHRSFIYLGNLIDAIITCITHVKARGATYLVSDGEDISTPELVRRIANALGCKARLIPVPVSLIRIGSRLTGRSSSADRLIGSLVVNSEKIRRDLAWDPPFSMEEGLKITAEWFHASHA